MLRLVAVTLLFVTFTAAAQDKFLAVWEDRVNQSENPEAKADDMCKDFLWDHRHKLAALDKDTLAKALKIVSWMEDHGYALPAKAQVAFGEFRELVEERELVSAAKGALYFSPAHTTPSAVPAPETSSTSNTTDYNQDLGGTLLPPPIHGAREP